MKYDEIWILSVRVLSKILIIFRDFFAKKKSDFGSVKLHFNHLIDSDKSEASFLVIFNLGSLYCYSCQMIVSAVFKTSAKHYNMQGLSLFMKNFEHLIRWKRNEPHRCRWYLDVGEVNLATVCKFWWQRIKQSLLSPTSQTCRQYRYCWWNM